MHLLIVEEERWPLQQRGQVWPQVNLVPDGLVGRLLIPDVGRFRELLEVGIDLWVIDLKSIPT